VHGPEENFLLTKKKVLKFLEAAWEHVTPRRKGGNLKPASWNQTILPCKALIMYVLYVADLLCESPSVRVSPRGYDMIINVKYFYYYLCL
jgi:hypothetical protein